MAGLVDFTEVFAPLRAHDYFRKVRVNSELGTTCWPNGADLDPDVLYSLISREPIVVADGKLAISSDLEPLPYRPEDFTPDDPFVREVLETGVGVV